MISCFECNQSADHNHHVVPTVLGGTRTVPLCEECHGKVHGLTLRNHGKLIKAGMAMATARGQRWGRVPVEIAEPKKAEMIERLRKEGKSIHKIAREVGLSSRTVWRPCKKDA